MEADGFNDGRKAGRGKVETLMTEANEDKYAIRNQAGLASDRAQSLAAAIFKVFVA